MEAIISILGYLLFALLAIIFSVWTFLRLFRYRGEGRTIWLILSIISLVVFIFFAGLAIWVGFRIIFFSKTIGGGGSGLAVAAMSYYLFITIAALVGLVAAAYSDSYTKLTFQKIRTILVVVITLIMYFPLVYYVSGMAVSMFKRGEIEGISIGRTSIGGISEEKAVSIAKQQINSGVNYQIATNIPPKKISNFTEDGAAAWEVTFEFFDKNGNRFMNHSLMLMPKTDQ